MNKLRNPDQPAIGDSASFEFSGDAWLEQIRQIDRFEGLGQWLGYEVLAPATRGGQAMVYRCRRSDGAVVAVKRIHGGPGASPAAKRRLERELEVASALIHPRIVRARTIRSNEELLLEAGWIEGRTLIDWCLGVGSGAPPAFPDLIRVMIGVCDAIQFAHDRGVIHRDLKPSNILVDGDDCPHVLDFGLAGTLAGFASDTTHVTVSEFLVGTPAYASPEQVAGDAARIDQRTDVYSLGVLLYEAFAGVSPYPPNLSLGRLLHSVEHVEPPRPRHQNPRVPRYIEAVILKAMQKDPGLRYPSVGALRADLERCLEGLSPTARPPGLWYDLRAFARRNPTFAWLTACAACALLATGIMISAYAARLSRAQKDTMAAHHAAERVNELLAGMIERAAPPIDDGGAHLVSLLNSTSRWLEEELKLDPWALARAHVSIGSMYAKAERWEQADSHLSRAIRDYRRLGDPDRTTVAQAMRLLGLARAYLGLPDAINLQKEAMDIALRGNGMSGPDLADFHASMAETLFISGGSEARADAEIQIGKAISSLRLRQPRAPAMEAELLSGYSRALIQSGEFGAAIENLLQASLLFEEADMPLDACPYHRASMTRLATAYEKAGDAASASAIRRRLSTANSHFTSQPDHTKGN